MKRPRSSLKRPILLPLALLSAAALVTPASANWFHDPILNLNRNIGSAPNPTPQDIRENRSLVYPLLSRSQNEQGTVKVAVSLTEFGAVTGIVVEQTSGFARLDDAAIEYVKEYWVRKPTNYSRPMASVVDVNVTFRLE